MQSPFPTKKFFFVLLFLVLAGSSVFKLFEYFHNRNAQNALDEQKLAIIQNDVLPLQGNRENIEVTPEMEQRVATSTINAIAAVVYLNEQTKANGATMDEITASVAKKIQDAKNNLDADTYTKNDILIGGDNSPDAIKKYGNDMAEIFLKYGKEKHPPYLEVIKVALETNDPKILKKLDPYIAFQKNVIRDALALKVPSVVAVSHLHIINASAEMLLLLQGFQTTFDDIPSAVASNSRLEKASQRFLDSFTEVVGVFTQNGVVFSPEEAGSLFINTAQETRDLFN